MTTERCPKCNGPADNGHDREMPPNAYYCSKCDTPQVVDVDALKKDIIFWAFYECQPDKGDVFGWLDDNVDSLAKHITARYSLVKKEGV